MSVPVAAEVKFANGSVVGLQRRAVMARLAEHRPTNEDSSTIPKLSLNGGVASRILRVHRLVHSASQVSRNCDVAIGAKQFRADANRPRPHFLAGGKREVRRILISIRGLERHLIGIDGLANNIDNPAQSV